MNIDIRILFKSFLFALMIHCLGLYVVKIKEVEKYFYQPLDVVLINDMLFFDKTPPLKTTDKQTVIPSFLSLPSGSVVDHASTSFYIRNLTYFSTPDKDNVFTNVDKMIDDDAYYYENELDANIFLPLDETQKKYMPFEKKEITQRYEKVNIHGYDISYVGYNKEVVLEKFKVFFEKVAKINIKPLSVLKLSLSFSENISLIECRIDQPSKQSIFDQEVIRLLKSYINPMLRNQKIVFHGQFIINWRGND